MLKWLDRLTWWWLGRRLGMTKQYGIWVAVRDGYTWKTVEKVGIPGAADPLEAIHTVGIKVTKCLE